MMVVWGHRYYGAVDRTTIDGHAEHAETNFFHLYWVPLVPTASFWVRDGVRLKIATYSRSVGRAYARWWGLGATVLVALAAAGLSAWCAVALAPCALALWHGFRRQPPPTARELRRGQFALATYGNRCPPHFLLPATRAHVATQLSAQWPDVGGGRAPEDVARLGARTHAEAALAYMLLVFASLETRGGEATGLAAAADRVLDGDIETVDGGPFRAGTVDVAPVQTLAAVSLVEPPAPRAVPAPVTRSERWLTHLLWWGFASVATFAGVVLAVQALEPPPLITAADLEPADWFGFGNPVSLARPDAIACTKLEELASDAPGVRTRCTTWQGTLVLISDISLTPCATPCTVWGPPAGDGLLVKAIAPSNKIRVTPVTGKLARLRCDRVDPTDQISGDFKVATCTTGDDVVGLAYVGSVPEPGMITGTPHGSLFVASEASRAGALAGSLLLALALPALAVVTLVRRRRATR